MPDPMIFFWNLRHLAEGSPTDRADAIKTTMDDRPAELNLFCEVMPNNKDPQSQCFNYRKSTDQQLCYGALIANGMNKTDRKNCPLNLYEPEISDCYRRGGFTGRKGSHDWKNIVDRGVGYTDAVQTTIPFC